MHVVDGCNSSTCMMCYKRNRATRVECTTIVNGVRRSFYVYANGGKGFANYTIGIVLIVIHSVLVVHLLVMKLRETCHYSLKDQ